MFVLLGKSAFSHFALGLIGGLVFLRSSCPVGRHDALGICAFLHAFSSPATVVFSRLASLGKTVKLLAVGHPKLVGSVWLLKVQSTFSLCFKATHTLVAAAMPPIPHLSIHKHCQAFRL